MQQLFLGPKECFHSLPQKACENSQEEMAGLFLTVSHLGLVDQRPKEREYSFFGVRLSSSKLVVLLHPLLFQGQSHLPKEHFFFFLAIYESFGIFTEIQPSLAKHWIPALFGG